MNVLPTATAKIVKYELRDVMRSRWLIAYALFFGVATDALLRFGGAGKALVSLTSVTLFIVPLVGLVFGTVYLDNAREFTELLLAQPITRRQLFSGLYLGLTLPLAGAFLAGVGIPLALHGVDDASLYVPLATLALVGVALSFVFTALAFVIAAWTDDRLRRMGAAIAVWLMVAVLYDGLVLVIVMLFGDYPIERPILALMVANPVDLARVVLLLQFDMSALMGYTGAAFQQFFVGGTGTAVAAAALAIWTAAPLMLGMRAFGKRDF
jgi:Cu-processing system permease protein